MYNFLDFFGKEKQFSYFLESFSCKGEITKQQRMSIERQIELDVEQAEEKFMDLYKVEVEEHSAKWKSHVGRKVEDSSGTSTIEVKESKSSGDSSTTTTKTTSSLKFSFAVTPRPLPEYAGLSDADKAYRILVNLGLIKEHQDPISPQLDDEELAPVGVWL